MPRGKRVSQETRDRVEAVLLSFLKKGWSQSQIAKHFDINQSTVSAILKGRDRPGQLTAEKVLGKGNVHAEAPAAPKPTRRGRVRKPERLPPGNRAGRKLRRQHVDERPGDVLCLPRRGQQQHELLAQPVVQDAEVIKLPKSRRAELDLQNKARMLAGHNQILIKVYSCLGCRKKFESVGDRMCVKCKGGEMPIISGQEIYL